MKSAILFTLRILAALYAALLAVFSFLPSGSGLLGDWDAALPSSLQTMLHLPAYALLAFLIILALSHTRPARASIIIFIALACISFGCVAEAAQARIAGRTPSYVDALMNVLGVLLGCLAAWVISRRHPKTFADIKDVPRPDTTPKSEA